MKKLILSLSVLLLLSSCTAWQSDTNTTDTSAKTETSNTNTTTYKQDIEDTSSKIKDSTEFEGCMKQQSSMCIQSAGMQIAQKMKDAKFCQELSNLEQRSSCEFAVVMINAQGKNDITLCDSLTSENYKQQCKMQLYRQDAIAKNDITLCDKIDIIMKSNNTGELNTGMGTQKDQCIMQFIMNNSTATELDCEKILDESSLMMCKMMVKEKAKWSPVLNNSTSIPK
jgi:hypothetical protein